MTGLFVVFEGGDSAGKSTQTKLLSAHLESRGIDHIVTRQPGGTPVGAKLRTILLDPASGDVAPRAEALIYAADKSQHVHEVILPALDAGKVVISDRYVDSMLAYQGAGRALDLAEVSEIAWWAVGGLRPDLTVLLDVDPAEAVESKATKDRLEAAGLEFHRRVREHLLDLASGSDAYLVLNGRESREAIAVKVAAAVDERLSS